MGCRHGAQIGGSVFKDVYSLCHIIPTHVVISKWLLRALLFKANLFLVYLQFVRWNGSHPFTTVQSRRCLRYSLNVLNRGTVPSLIVHLVGFFKITTFMKEDLGGKKNARHIRGCPKKALMHSFEKSPHLKGLANYLFIPFLASLIQTWSRGWP